MNKIAEQCSCGARGKTKRKVYNMRGQLLWIERHCRVCNKPQPRVMKWK